MYIRTVRRKNKDGSIVEYMQLAHNVWNKQTHHGVPKVIHSLGRKENINPASLKRLISSIQKAIDTLESQPTTVNFPSNAQ